MGNRTLEGYLYLYVPAYTITAVDHLDSKRLIYLHHQVSTNLPTNNKHQRPIFNYNSLTNDKSVILRSMKAPITDIELEQRFCAKPNLIHTSLSKMYVDHIAHKCAMC